MWLGGFLAGGLFRVPSVMGLEVMFLMDDRLTLGTTHVPCFFFFFFFTFFCVHNKQMHHLERPRTPVVPMAMRCFLSERILKL